jgi:hypothetical protein
VTRKPTTKIQVDEDKGRREWKDEGFEGLRGLKKVIREGKEETWRVE